MGRRKRPVEEDPKTGMRRGRPIAEAMVNHDPEAILTVLNRHRVEYVLIGGFAAVVQSGWNRVTDDIDVTPSRADENLERLHSALVELEAEARTAESDYANPDIPLDPSMMGKMMNLALVTKHGLLDLSFVPDGTAGFDDLQRGANRRVVLGLEISVASLSDIIRSKKATGRQKDLDVLGELEDLHRQQTEEN